MKLIKHYDFTKMTTLDTSWNVSVGDKWQNEELQQYHNHKDNIFFDHGLVLQATYNNGIIKSGRINTKDNLSFKYGLIELTAKIPSGKGTWPAFWMMPQDSIYGFWPKSGEIDILEYSANNKDVLTYALHTEAHNHKTKNEYVTHIKKENITDDFHKFSILWEENKIVYYLDDQEIVRYERGMNEKDSSHKGWPFTENFYLILNLAIGGWMGGPVDYTSFPQQFIIKDLKVYQK